MTMSRRPLTSSDADADLFVDRDDEIRRIERSIELRANVLVVGPPGSGKTSLLRRLQARSREAGDEWVYVDCSPWDELEGVLAAIGASLGRDLRNRPRAMELRDAELATALFTVQTPRIITEIDINRIVAGEPRVIAVDGLRPELAFDLFGRFRDTLWEHEHRWVVAADEVYRGEFLRPPADVFFENVIDLDAFEPETVLKMLLARRARLPEDDATKLTVIASKFLGEQQPPRYPGSVMAIARELLASDRSFDELLRVRSVVEREAEEIGATAANVFRALLDLGAMHAGDERLLHRVDLSRARVVQVLKDLEAAGIVSARRQGRRVLYDVAWESMAK